jgi:LmbE family N-acetylglucosaminyl deacetylase
MIDFRNKKILVVAAHPDDEILGCGGTLVRAFKAGAQASILLLGEGPTARADAPAESGRKQAEKDRNALLDKLRRFSRHEVGLECANFPDNRFDSVALLDIVQWIEARALPFEPDLVFTQHVGDLNNDHVLTQRAVLTVFRPLPMVRIPQIFSFEVMSSTEYGVPGDLVFQPNCYVDIAEELDDKQALLECYDSEMRPFPHPRSYEAVRAQARLRGAQCGCAAAEAFMFLRGVAYR